MSRMTLTIKQTCLLLQLKQTGMTIEEVTAGYNDIDELEDAQIIGANGSFMNTSGSLSNGNTRTSLADSSRLSASGGSMGGSTRKRKAVAGSSGGSGGKQKLQISPKLYGNRRRKYPSQSTMKQDEDEAEEQEEEEEDDNDTVVTANVKKRTSEQHQTVNVGSPVNNDDGVAELLKEDIFTVRDEIRDFMARHSFIKSDISKATSNKLKSLYLFRWFKEPKIGLGTNVRLLYQWYLNMKGEKGEMNFSHDEMRPGEGDEADSYISDHELVLATSEDEESGDLLWLSVCEPYLIGIVTDKNSEEDAALEYDELDDICEKCTELLRQYYSNCGVYRDVCVSRAQVINYLSLKSINMLEKIDTEAELSRVPMIENGDSAAAELHLSNVDTSLNDVSEEAIDTLMSRPVMGVKNEIQAFMVKHKITQKSVQENPGSMFSKQWLSYWLIRPTSTSKHIRSLYRWYLSAKNSIV